MAYKEFLPKQSALGFDWIVCDCITTRWKMATKIGKVVAVIHRIEDSPSFVGFEGRTYPFFYYLQCTWKSMNKVHSRSNTYFHWLPNLKSINFGHKFTMWWLLATFISINIKLWNHFRIETFYEKKFTRILIRNYLTME
jgi:hypothetical protein